LRGFFFTFEVMSALVIDQNHNVQPLPKPNSVSDKYSALFAKYSVSFAKYHRIPAFYTRRDISLV
jgi:hypothetical protein